MRRTADRRDISRRCHGNQLSLSNQPINDAHVSSYELTTSSSRWTCYRQKQQHLLSVCNQRLYLLSQLRKQGLLDNDKCKWYVYDAIVWSNCLHGWGGYTSQSLTDRTDASFRKARRWKLTCARYNFTDLLFDVVNSLHAATVNCIVCIICYHCVLVAAR